MGNQKNQGEVSIPFVDSIWRKVNALYCKTNTVHKNDNESFNLYPNPANDELHIQIPDNHFNIKIYNLTGNLILESQNEKNISISDLQKGMYFLELKSKETNGKRIFIKSE
jgi:aminopeptidase YwaD